MTIADPAVRASEVRSAAEDPHLWLEEVLDERALDWVRAKNAVAQRQLEAHPDFERMRRQFLDVLNSKDRIPYASKHGGHLYSFWRDEQNVRGVWRRTTFDEYRKPAPKWEIVLDLDALAKRENENWVWHGADILYPDRDRALVSLSRGGADADVTREFDLVQKDFVPEGFFLPEAKSWVAWRNRDTVYVGTDFGPGTLTSSGYPRIVKEWVRGTPLESARILFVGETSDVWATMQVVQQPGRSYDFLVRGMTFFSNRTYARQGDAWEMIEKPDDAKVRVFNDHLLLELRSDWEVGGKSYKAGSLLASPFAEYMKGARQFALLHEPHERRSLESVNSTKNYLLLGELENVRSRTYAWSIDNGEWKRRPIEAPEFSSVEVWGVDRLENDDYWMTTESFIAPTTLHWGAVNKPEREQLKALPAFFNAEGLEVIQHEVKSKDGTRVPYFVVARKNIELNGGNRTLLYGYGGFEISLTPSYSALVGSAWLEKGNVYVLANIRGGGEFGPAWHQAALKANRQKAYDDFIAVAEDLVSRKITVPSRLGILGGSNGGLLMGAMLTQRPELFGAIVCKVPLLDMRRYNKLLAGASWMGEYGNPDLPEEWEFISKYSPYQNVRKEAKYPPILFTTSTRDDRVHPGHARKMVARMKEQGHTVLYYENIEGGHGGAANNEQQAYMNALGYAFLLRELK